MPCNDGGGPGSGGYDSYDISQAEKRGRESMSPLLCSACRSLEKLGFSFAENPALDKWWDNHKKEDAAREERERRAELARLRKAAEERQAIEVAKSKRISELTTSEKSLLKRYGLL